MELYLITGFLGAGKTTLVKNLIELMRGRRLAVIVNEFGKEGMDAELLAPLQVAVNEIAGGSVFCSCRLDQFEAVLAEVAGMAGPGGAHAPGDPAAPEVILVEASGLSDPGNIEKIMQQPQFAAITYKGSLCVVDAGSFEKVLATVRVAKKQLAISRVVVVNKADLVDEAALDAVCGQIRGLVPDAKMHTTSFGKVQAGWLGEMAAMGGGDAVMQTRDLGLTEKRVMFRGITRYQLGKFVEMIAEDTHRIKGFVRCQDGLFLVDCVGGRIRIEPYEETGGGHLHEGLSVMAGPGLPMQKSLKQAAEWYREQVLEIY